MPYGDSICEPPSLGTRLYSFWANSPNRSLKAAIAFTGLITGPVLVVAGAGLTAVGFVGMVGGCLCCCIAASGSNHHMYTDDILREFEARGGACSEVCCYSSIWLVQSGTTTAGLGVAAFIGGVPVGIYQLAKKCTEEPTVQLTTETHLVP